MSQRADRNGIDPPVEKERRDLRREPIEVDSATGEGGGQVLRSVLRLSLLTGQPFRPSREIAGRQRSRVLRRLHKRLPDIEPEVMVEELPAASCGTGLLLPAECQSERACCFALGARGKRAELVADAAVDALAAFLISVGISAHRDHSFRFIVTARFGRT
jgi:RNA 3'-terminal phosphate cyclase